MSQVVIQVEGISKQYRLGMVSSGTLSQDIGRWWAKFRGKEDPFLKLGDRNDRTSKGSGDLVWALKDISFEVKQGEVLGIIGKNGAGKSTLLKILARTTTPTTGRIGIKGRIASLLEVGTGFHPELSGRENIFLNGAILGMTKQEIRRKFDEIVAFSGVERYIDTPVKRYSSGMYVRLAFAVAAHLEPEILIVDEVLAVGDVEFQRRCIGKMKEVSREGRTVLFVSHNLQAMSTLTTRCLLLKEGILRSDDLTPEVIKRYLQDDSVTEAVYTNRADRDHTFIQSASIQTSLPNNVQEHGKPMQVEFKLNIAEPLEGAALSFQIMDQMESPVSHLWNFDAEIPFGRKAGIVSLRCSIPKVHLYMGRYFLRIHFGEVATGKKIETISRACPFEVVMYGKLRDYNWTPGVASYLEDAEWNVIQHAE